jgi:hypothetical protein
VATLNVDATNYKGCASDVVGQWFYFYLMRLAQNKILDVARTQSGLRQTGGKGALFSPYTFMSEKAAMIWVQNIKTNMKL